MAAQELELQRKQDEAIEAYARKKEAMTAERARREEERRAAKDAQRKAIADAMESNFLQIMAQVC
jgi:hypothetical protein